MKKAFVILELDYDPTQADPPDEWAWDWLLDLKSDESVRVNVFYSALDMLDALMEHELKGQVWHGKHNAD